MRVGGPAAGVLVAWTDQRTSPGAASELLASEVSRLTGIPPEQVRLTRSCPQCASSEHGRPVLLPTAGRRMPFVSLARSGDVVLVAVCDAAPVGVDVERLDGVGFAGFGDVALHARETASSVEERARTWVRKESLLKATGDGLHRDPRLVRLSDPDQPPRLLEWPAPAAPWPGVWMQDLDLAGHAACVTVLSDRAPRVSLRAGATAARSR